MSLSLPRILLAAFVFLLAGCGEYEEREREVGFKGVARVNPLLAAERMANEMGLKAASYQGAPSLPPAPGTTLILPAESLQGEGQLEEIADWVLDGGNLIAYLTLENKRSELRGEGDNGEDRFVPFLTYFGLTYELNPSEKESTEWGGRIEALSFEEDSIQSYRAQYRSPYLLSDTDFAEDPPRPIRCYDYGDGSLTVLGSAQLFDNKHLGEGEHATLLWDLLSFGQEEQVWFIHSTRLSFARLLWQQAPQAVVMLAVVLGLLVWWAARGFGPKFVRGADPAAKLDEHLEASGAFFLKHRAEGLVIARLRERIFRRLARSTNLPFNVEVAELLTAGRKEEVLSAVESEALTSEPNPKNLLEILRTLKSLDKRL